MIHTPKFIKKAGLWLVHEVSLGNDKKEVQKMNWFDSQEKALQFIKENEK